MRKRFALLLTGLLFFMAVKVTAQSAVSKVIHFSHEDLTNIFMPPELYIDGVFIDDNDNKILEARENGVLRLILSNRGGDADVVNVMVNPVTKYKGLVFDKMIEITSVKSNEQSIIDFPISATIDIPTETLRFSIKVSEPLGYDSDASLSFQSFEYQKAKIKMQGVSIIDAGPGTKTNNNNPDGKVQKGEVVYAIVSIQNTGSGIANNNQYTIISKDPNVILMTESEPVPSISGTIDKLLSGETKDISFRMSVNNNYKITSTSEYLPVFISIEEEENFGNLPSSNIPIPLDKTPAKPTIVDIKGEYNKLPKGEVVFEPPTAPGRRTTNIRDISVAPLCVVPLFKDAVAIVIGAEQNSYGVAPAPYAARDAEIMAKFFKNSLGIDDIHLITDNEVTKNGLSDLLDSSYGYLSRVVLPEKTDVFVYYSGHGIPDISSDGSQDIYLFPYDARKEQVKDRGYSLNKLYADLNSLNAHSVTVILDACFSGSSRQSVTFESKNISNEKGIRISMPQMTNRPWDTNPYFRVFTSSTEDQTSLSYDLSRSGLFTYFLAIGLQGDADKDGDGNIKFNELVDYVTTNVKSESKKIRGAEQSPQFYGDGNFVIEKIK